MKKSKILIIIPAYNEEANIEKTIAGINNSKVKVDYIVINDGSSDKTKDILAKNNFSHINLVHNLGIGGAIQTGYKYALTNDYDIAIQFDGDGQHDISYIEDLINPIVERQADFVIGSRFIKNKKSKFQSTGARRAGIKIISFLIKLFTGSEITDPTSGFRAASKEVIKQFASDYPTEYPEPESLTSILKADYKIVEVPVEMNERSGGKSSIYSWKSIYYMLNVCLSIFVTGIKRRRK